MSWLLDTDVLSEIRKGERADGRVRGWFAAAPGEDLFTSVVVLGELRRGVELKRRHDVTTAIALEQWLLRLETTFAGHVLAVDAAVADRWGRLNAPDPLPTVDGLLAATALVHEMTVVTRNASDLARTGAALLNPWSARG